MNKREYKEIGCAVYRNSIVEIVNKIDSAQHLKRIYLLAEYLYLYKNID